MPIFAEINDIFDGYTAFIYPIKHNQNIEFTNMAKYSRKNKVSEQTKDEAMKIARGTQKPGQTKEQTRLIAQGVQKGIEQYKKQQSEKKRELDKKLKKASSRLLSESSTDSASEPELVKPNKLPWVLLVLSWLGFLTYIVMVK